MARAPRSAPSAGISLAGFLVFLLAVAVIGGTAYGYTRWRDEIAQATDSAVVERDRPADEDLPDAPDSPDDVIGEPEEADTYEPPTFDLLKPTDNRPRPVVLVLGDGYAAGRGASAPDLAYPALLGTDLGWDVRTEAAVGAGYVSAPPTLLDLLTGLPASFTPDLVVVQGAYGSDASNGDAKTAIEALATAIEDRYPVVPLVTVSTITAEETDKQAETRERTVARAWREVPDTLVQRPQTDGWQVPIEAGAPTDAGHRAIADELIDAFRTAGLAKQP